MKDARIFMKQRAEKRKGVDDDVGEMEMMNVIFVLMRGKKIRLTHPTPLPPNRDPMPF